MKKKSKEEKELDKKMNSLKDATFMEKYAFFMGYAQILEFALKRILIKDHNMTEESLKTITMGATISILKTKGLNPQFSALMKQVLDYRNSLAHDFLLDDVLVKSITGGLGFIKTHLNLEKP